MKIEVYADKATKELKKLATELSDDKVNKSIARAINSTLGLVKTQINREIRAKYRLGTTEINKGLFIKQSTYSTLTGKILASPKTFPLTMFNPTEIKNNVITKRIGGKKGSFASKQVRKSAYEGVMIEIIKGEKKVIQSAFLVFKGKSNGSVKAKGSYSSGFGFNDQERATSLSTVSVASILRNGAIKQDLSTYINKEYSRILESELKKRINNIK